MSFGTTCALVWLALLSLPGALCAHTIVAGDHLSTFEIADQHGRSATVDDTTRILLFSRDMSANKLVRKALGDRDAEFLPRAHAMYLIDLSDMPKFITTKFAIPKMRKYPYRIFLDSDASLTSAIPAQGSKVTVLHLDHLTVRSIEYADSTELLLQALSEQAP